MQADFYDEYVETDPVTGEQKTLALDEKEKLYLECLDAYYNEGGKQLLGNEEYEQLKLDLDFEGSTIATYSKDEVKFVLAVKRAPPRTDRGRAPLAAPIANALAPVGVRCSLRAGATTWASPSSRTLSTTTSETS